MALNDPAKLRQRVGARIAELRVARGWTQELLAERIEVSTRYLQAVEGGQENLTLESLAKIGNVLRVRVGDLFADAEPRPRPPHRGVGRRGP